ncbi:LysM peptidoglycan-binding domain-containing protein [Burkholderia plantarii]|uniref:LysM peptidoglycan-binding domain-containing protein n=1 Tax=Burkholderia plantarii TaxID=41899 RepID=UPI00272CA3FB|nr:LysM peptidoglycan-binding domain-containing protein [Burkholderia plantarii]WLE58835.1 LysM peptidoglycan-binding domain-containing protein [Burkholderia plantarii]
MVGIVTGNGLGLQSSSLQGLGGRGVLGSAAFGQSGESVYVNVANGNLMIQDRDQMLLGQGVSGAVYRAYNSLGQLAGDSWREGATRSVGELSGTLGAAGSTIVQTDWDGSYTTYTYDAALGAYVSNAPTGVAIGDALNPGLAPVTTTGAHATIRFDAAANRWIWSDGRGQATETYDAGNGGRLVASRDEDGNTVSYVYDAARRLTTVATSGGDVTRLDYDAAGRLAALRSTYRLAGGQQATETSVYYGYDALGRLSSVTIDLTPQDGSIADGQVFTTTYTYDGDSQRVASLAQSDGSRLAFTYTLDYGLYRVATITQTGVDGIDRVTRLQYDLANQRVTVVDPLGFAQQLDWDAAGRLTRVSNLSEARSISFRYDAAGNLVHQSDTALGDIDLSYDAAGNLIRQSGLLSSITRTYGAHNELLTETIGGPYPAAEFGTETTRYAYDALGHLRYVVSAEGRVTEYRYDAAGQRISEIHYASAVYDVSALPDTRALSLGALDTWAGGAGVRQNALRIDSSYDWRGNLAVQTRYERLLADGTGDPSGGITQMRYVYDPHGRLLQHYVGVPGQEQVEQFAYDGLGRLLASTSFDGALTTYQYDDVHHAVSVTFASGLTRTSTYDSAGALVSTVERAHGTTLSQVRNAYDPDGRLSMSTDADGRSTHYLYNSRNQQVAVIGPDGTLTETVYDAATALQTKTITYATRLTAAQLATLVDGNGRPLSRTASGAALTLDNANLRPAGTAADRWEISARTNAGWIDHTIDSEGVVTQYDYDGFGQLISKTVRYNRFDPNAIPATGLPPANPQRDRTTHYLYDRDGLLRGEIDPQGYLTETRYNAAGERTEVIAYATPVDETLRNAFAASPASPPSPTLAMLIPAASARDVVTRYVYDARGLLSAEIDGEGYLTRYQYDARGNLTERVTGQRVAQDTLGQPQLVWLRLAMSGTVGATVGVRMDGVLVGTVTLTSSDYAGYSLAVPGVVALDVHTIEFDISTANPVTLYVASLGEHPLTPIVASPSASLSPQVVNPRYTLDAAALLAGAPAPDAIERTTYAYDAMGRLLGQVTAAVTGTSTTRYTYDAMGKVLTETQGTPPHESTITYEYDVQGRLVRKYSGEASRILASIAQAEAGGDAATAAALRGQLFSETYTYDAAGLRTSSTDAIGRKTLYYYDAYDRVVATVNAAGEVVRQSRDAFGNIEQTVAYAVRLAAGTLAGLQGGRLGDDVAAVFAALDSADTSYTRFHYDTDGRLTRQTDALGQAVDYAYDAFGQVASKTQDVANGVRRRTFYDYDRAGNQTWQLADVDGLKLVTTAAYDAFGRATQTVDANGVSRFSDYDRDGRLVSVRDSAGQTHTTYDAFGNVLTQTDRLGNTTRYSYDAANRQVHMMTLEGIVTTTTYDELGQVVALTDGRGDTVTSEYDLDGNLVRTTSPTTTLTYRYDHAGQRLAEGGAAAGGATTQYTYDLAGRVLTRTQFVSSSEASLTTRYEYDAKGHLVQTTDPSGMVTRTRYDAIGQRVSVVVDPDGRRLATSFTYDATGQVLTVTEGDGSATPKVTRNVYDSAGRLQERIVDPDGLRLSTRYAYDAMGNAVAVTDATGAVTRYVYDAAGRQTWVLGPTGAVTHFVRDAEGRIVSQEKFATPIDVSGLPSRLTETQLLASVIRSAADQIDYSTYDALGQLRYATDALGHVKEQVYDGAGNVVRVIAYAGASDPRSLGTAADHVTRMVYDGGNRLIATIDAAGTVTRNVYDVNGNVTQRIQYDAAYAAAGEIDAAAFENQMQAWLQSPAMAGRIHVTTQVYDAVNRLRYTVDAEGYVTENRYDGAGRLAQTVRYARRYAGSDDNYATLAGYFADPAQLAQAAVTGYRYDGAGRLIETTDAQQVVTRYALDALGRVTDTTVAAGTADASTTHNVYDVAGNLIQKTVGYGTAVASTTGYSYDGVGRQLTATDAQGFELIEHDTSWTLGERSQLGVVDASGAPLAMAALTDAQKLRLLQAHTSTQSYDAAGRLIAKVDALGNTTRYQYDAFGNAVTTTDPMGAVTVSFYDKLNRVVAQVSPENWVVGTNYDAFGNVSKVTDYLSARAGAMDDAWKRDGWRLDPATILPPSDPKDAVTRMEYDKLGRLTRSTDAEGYVQTYAYDGFGNRVSYTNKVGGTFAYTYDGMGHMLSETLPVTSSGWPVVNRYEYDARGNRITSIEAQGLPEERVTRYGFDLLNRQVSTTKQVELAGTTGTVTEQSIYDVRGNLISQIDANGHATTWYYDAVGRKTGEVSATGTLTLWTYDEAGNVLRLRVFGDPVQPTRGSQPPAPVDQTNVRETRFIYDADAHVLESRVVDVASGRFVLNSDSNPTTPIDVKEEYVISSGADLITRWEYDGRGAMIAKVDPAGGRTVYFYNGSGQKILEIDPMHYGIAYDLDARGEVVRETRFATAFPDQYTSNQSAARNLIDTWPRSADDRITEYTWDRNGRKTSESRLNVQYATVDDNGKLLQQVGSATTQYQYDGEGNLLDQIDANNNRYDYVYDALGHRVSEKLPTFLDYHGSATRATTLYEYDGLGNLVKETRKGDVDQVTFYQYGVGGRLVNKVYANGNYINYSYDAAGNIVGFAQARDDADGQRLVDITTLLYDARNRETYRSVQLAAPDGSVQNTGTTHETRYDAYGDVVARRTNGGGPNGEWQEYADYDNAGRVVRTNFDDGISHLYMYDRNGNATLKIESMGSDLRSFSIETVTDLNALLQRVDMMQTFTLYDARNEVVQIRQPKTSAGQPRVGFAPVDIQIEGGTFANTVLKIGGWLSKDDLKVTLPAYYDEVTPTMLTSGTVTATTSVDWAPGAWFGSSIQVNSINVNVPNLLSLFGAYQLEVDVSYHITGSDPIFGHSINDASYVPIDLQGSQPIFTGTNPSEPITLPINYTNSELYHPNGLHVTNIRLDYSVQIYVLPQNSGGGRIGLGRIDKSTNLYVQPANPNSIMGTFAASDAANGSLTLQSLANRLTVVNSNMPDGASGQLYFRPARSTQTFAPLNRDPGGSPKSYTVDVGGLADGYYELIFMAVSNGNDGHPPGTLLRRDGYIMHIARGTGSTVASNPIPLAEAYGEAGFVSDITGNYIWTYPQTLNLYTLHASADVTKLAAAINVKVRQNGTTQWGNATTFYRDPVSGAFSLDMSGYSPGNWDVEIDLFGADGAKLDVLNGTVGLSGTGDSPWFSFHYIEDLNTSVTFSEPSNVDYLDVSWEQDGQTRYARVPRVGDQLVWDASSLVPSDGQPRAYSIQFTAYDTAGRPVSMGKGDITVGGYGATTIQLTGSQSRTYLKFQPTGLDGQPLPASMLTLFYRASTDKDHDYDRPFSQVTLTRDASGYFVFDATDLPTDVEFEYRYQAKDAAGNVLLERGSYFDTGTRNNPATNTDIISGFYQTTLDSTIDRLQLHNAFGEVSSERDGRGNWTDSQYNTMGSLVLKREPQVSVTLANGVKVQTRPETSFYYDRTGNLVGTRDADGNLSTQQWNYGSATPTIAKIWDALGNAKQMQYDSFGNLRTSYDELRRRTDYLYDAKNRLIEIDRPVLANGQRSVDRYEYDSLDQRIAHTDALGDRERTYYDADGRIVRTVSAAGRTLTYDYRWASSIGSAGAATTGGWVRTTTNANGMTIVDQNDLFGRLMIHTDLGGHVFQYLYNWAGLLSQQRGTSGQNVDYTYYSNGLVRSIVDNTEQTQSLYEYDGDGNRTAEYFTNFGYTYIFAQSAVTYDALNRVTAIEDSSYKVYYEYDAVGNRRRMQAVYTDLVGSHQQKQDYWYEYDALNRFTVSMGSLSGAPATDPNDTSVHIVAGSAGGDGVQIAYNAAGERTVAVYAKDGRTETYEYDANGYLSTQRVNNAIVQQRTNDLMGRVTTFLEYDPATGQQVTGLSRDWDADGMLKLERDDLHGASTSYTRMADGTLTQIATTPNDTRQTSTVSTYAYEWWDDAKQSRVTTQATNPNSPGWKPATSYFNYDANGNLQSTYDDGGNQPGNARAFQYWTDLRGQVQRRDELTGASVDANGKIYGASGDRKHNYYYLNGNRIGNQGNDGIDQIDYMQELAGKLGKGDDNQYKVFTPISAADFDENYMPINGMYPAQSAGQWTVRDGDTLQSVASALWGDSSLWYILADANGLKNGDELRLGQLLTVPNKVTNIHNNATTFKPYDPGRAIGDTQPTLPSPPPPPTPGPEVAGGCGQFLPIIAIVVAVVVTALTYGAASPATASLTAGAAGGAASSTAAATAAAAAAGAVAGAAGAAASQLVLIAGGAQSGFSWKAVGLGALGGAVSAGLGGSSAGLGGSSVEAGGFGQQVLLGATRSLVTQGLGVATGLQDRFDWKSVAAGAIASGVGSAVRQTAVGRTSYVGEVASGVAAGAASTLVRGGSLSRDFGAIAADAVASTVGNMVADRIKSQPSSISSLYGPGGDVNAMVQGAYPVDPGKQFAWSANARLQPASSSFDSTAASLGLSTEQALRLMAPSSNASIVDSNGPTSAVSYPVPTPYIRAVEIPGGPPLKSIPVLTETDGGFWRGLAGDRRSVFETPAPLSEKIGAGVRAVGEFIADPLIELGNQYRDVYSAASGATGGWRSAFAQQVSDGSYGGAALTELGMAAGAAPMAGAALRGIGFAAPAAVETFGPAVSRAMNSYMTRSGMQLNVVEAGSSGISRAGLVDLSAGDVAPGFYRADPAQIRFTQSDASPFFSKGGTIDSLVSDLRSGKVIADQVGNPLQVVMHEGLPFSIDNRRLVAFNLAGVRDVPIQVVTLDNPAVAARFFDRFDPIGGVGKNIVIVPSSARTAAQLLLRDSGLIKGVQLGY